MPRMKISLTRFKWKSPQWQELQYVQSIWLYSQQGLLSFEMEVDSSIEIPASDQQHARNSKNLEKSNFLLLKNAQIISKIGEKIKKFDIRGAVGKSVLLGEIQVLENKRTYTFPIYSTLHDWYDFISNSEERFDHLKSSIKFS